VTCGGAALRHRPGRAWNEARREPAPVLALGDRANGRRARCRVDPARERRRRRAHSDIHGAKGLEFPVTIVSGMSTAPRTGPRRPKWSFPTAGTRRRHRRLQVRGKVTTNEYVEWARSTSRWPPRTHPTALRGLHQGPRHLIMSVHRKVRTNPPKPSAAPTPSCSSTAWRTDGRLPMPHQ